MVSISQTQLPWLLRSESTGPRFFELGGRGIHERLLEQWLQDDLIHRTTHGPQHGPLQQLRMKKKYIAKALRCSSNSSPGPDGIPYEAWRAMGELSVEVLFGAFQDLASDSAEEIMAEDNEDFNASILHFLSNLLVTFWQLVGYFLVTIR